MYFAIANFGDDSIATIKWLHLNKIIDVTVLSVDTGWQASQWQKRVDEAKKWLLDIGYKHYHLKSEHSFDEMVEARKSFPNYEFHWCSGFLKGITILNSLDDLDPKNEGIIILPHQKRMSKRFSFLKEHEDESERYDDRAIWRPLCNHTEEQRDLLIAETPFLTPLNHRSLECQPCIHSNSDDFNNLSKHDIKKLEKLENKIKKNMFDESIEKCKFKNSDNYYDDFAKTCGWDYACGL